MSFKANTGPKISAVNTEFRFFTRSSARWYRTCYYIGRMTNKEKAERVIESLARFRGLLESLPADDVLTEDEYWLSIADTDFGDN
jgi:hypothetical protein